MPTAVGVRRHATALFVSGSQVAVAASGYLILVAAGRTLTAEAFTAVSAFYMLLNTVARGLFQAAELELTRAVTTARTLGDPGRRTTMVVLRRVLGLLAAAFVLLGAATPFLLAVLDHDPATVAILFVATAAVAASHVVRGPLAALGRYQAYATAFAVEAAACVVGAGVLLLVGERHPAAWCAVFALGPLVATLVVAGLLIGAPVRRRMVGAWREPASPEPTVGSPNTAGLLWSAVIFLASQAVWNLSAVVVTARADLPEIAAGFAAVSVLLRAPVLVFPAIQALVLPAVTAEAARGARGLLADTLRRRAVPLAALVCVWMLTALAVVPVATRLMFGLNVLPDLGVIAALAASAALGAAASLTQTQLVARSRQRAVALAWLGGLVVLLVVVASPVGAIDTLGGVAQLSATVVVLAALLISLFRRPARHLDRPPALNPV